MLDKINYNHIGSSLKEVIDDFVKNDEEALNLMKKQEIINDISSQVVETRQLLGITQEELAKKINTKQASISRLEKNNGNKLPSLEFLFKIAISLNKRIVINFL